MNYESSWTKPGEGFVKEAIPPSGQKEPYVAQAAKAYLKKNFKKLSK